MSAPSPAATFGGVGEAFVRHRQEHCCPQEGHSSCMG